jgi:2-keto-4-pentenoate hydratase/2-oxohepta-3-ene-1,7-dioic acid hydratase in catechol pathway
MVDLKLAFRAAHLNWEMQHLSPKTGGRARTDPADTSMIRSAEEAGLNSERLEDMLRFLNGGGEALSLARTVLEFVQERLPGLSGGDPGLENALYPIEGITLLPPLLHPGKIICVGLNYPGSESDLAAPAFPVLFNKVATSLVGQNQPILIPRITNHVVYEGELAIVIGRTGKHIAREQADDFIAGYTIANDVGAPDLERRTSQWTTGKILDTFCPLGPTLVTREEVSAPKLADKDHAKW